MNTRSLRELSSVAHSERRHHPRYQARLAGSINTSVEPGAPTSAVAIRDIGLGGAYFHCPLKLTIGQALDFGIEDAGDIFVRELGLTRTNGAHLRLQIHGEVIRVEPSTATHGPDGVAICFSGPLRIVGAAGSGAFAAHPDLE
jgi:hypothetical protein